MTIRTAVSLKLIGKLFGLTGALLGAVTSPALAQSPAGLALVQEHCAMCHAIGKTDNSPHPGAPPLRRLGDSYNFDEFEDLIGRGIILASHPDMPTFKVDRAAARAITSYLRSIQQ